MNSLDQNLPLQEMIRRTINSATEKLASSEAAHAERVRYASSDQPKTEKVKTASAPLTDPEYIEKLASACDHIAQNIDDIEITQRGVLGKFAAAGSPATHGETEGPAVHTPGGSVLEATKAMGGKQAYKKDKPAGEDAAASEHGSPLSTGGLPGGKTQMDNNMHDAPGGGSVKPTGKYPEKGPLVNIKTAAEEVLDRYHAVVEKNAGIGTAAGDLAAKAKLLAHTGVDAAKLHGGGAIEALKHQAGRVGEAVAASPHEGAIRGALMGGGGGALLGAGAGAVGADEGHAGRGALKGALAGGVAGGGLGGLAGHGLDKLVKHASPAEAAKAAILLKLAGEDVMKANISAKASANPLAGKGQLETTEANQSSPHQAGDPTSGFGNQGRKHIQSNQGAIDLTKGEAKGPQKTQLKEVLEEPALSSKHDSKLRENLRNASSAGVKIAEARTALLKIASAGCQCGGKGKCGYCLMQSSLTKTAEMGMGGGASAGGGMAAMAQGDTSPDGCTCGQTGQCQVCRLKAALSQASTAAAAGQGGQPGPAQPGMAQ